MASQKSAPPPQTTPLVMLRPRPALVGGGAHKHASGSLSSKDPPLHADKLTVKHKPAVAANLAKDKREKEQEREREKDKRRAPPLSTTPAQGQGSEWEELDRVLAAAAHSN